MLKLTLMIALLGSTVMADGEMGSGGITGCTTNCPPQSGLTITQEDTDFSVETTDVVIEIVEQYLLFKY